MARLTDIRRIIESKEYWQKERAESWDAFTRHMEMGELREYKQHCIDEDTIIDALKWYLHYKILQEVGYLVVLPCKVGDTVYEIYNNTSACLKCDCFDENPYEAITWCRNENRKETEYFEGWHPEIQEEPVCEKQFMDIREKQPNIYWIFNNREQFGKTVFLTREEAEAALKGSDLNEHKQSITRILENVAEDICDNHCKYRETCDEDALCDITHSGGECPLDKLV